MRSKGFCHSHGEIGRVVEMLEVVLKGASSVSPEVEHGLMDESKRTCSGRVVMGL